MFETPYLESERLIFQKPDDEGYEFFRQLLIDESLTNFKRPAIAVSLDQLVETKVQEMKDHWEKHGFGLYIVIFKGNLEKIGISAPRFLILEGKEVLDIGGMILKAYEGYGFPSESLRAMHNLLFCKYKFAKVQATVEENNALTQRILERSGYKCAKSGVLETTSLPRPVRYYELTRESYAKGEV